MEPITLSSQIIALIAALTVGIPTEALDDLPGNFAGAAVRENRTKVVQAVRNVRAAIRDVVRHRADAEA